MSFISIIYIVSACTLLIFQNCSKFNPSSSNGGSNSPQRNNSPTEVSKLFVETGNQFRPVRLGAGAAALNLSYNDTGMEKLAYDSCIEVHQDLGSGANRVDMQSRPEKVCPFKFYRTGGLITNKVSFFEVTDLQLRETFPIYRIDCRFSEDANAALSVQLPTSPNFSPSQRYSSQKIRRTTDCTLESVLGKIVYTLISESIFESYENGLASIEKISLHMTVNSKTYIHEFLEEKLTQADRNANTSNKILDVLVYKVNGAITDSAEFPNLGFLDEGHF